MVYEGILEVDEQSMDDTHSDTETDSYSESDTTLDPDSDHGCTCWKFWNLKLQIIFTKFFLLHCYCVY